MEVRIVEFPETRVAAIEHRGPPELEHSTARKLIDWRMANRLSPEHHRTYGVHYTDPRATPPSEHRVDFCLSFDGEVAANTQGIVTKVIPANRCALARHVGSRAHNLAALYLWETWFPSSGEQPGDFPIFFHYVNVGPNIQERDMLTDVYLPLRPTRTA